MLDLTADDLGAWITADEVRHNTVIFSVRVIDLAVANGLGIDWDADRAVIVAGVADNELLMWLDDLYYDALDYLNSITPKPFYFTTNQDGLFLKDRSAVSAH